MSSIARGWVSLRGAASYTGLPPSTISRAVHSGALPAYQVSKAFRINIEDIDAWVRTFPSVREEQTCSAS